MNDSDIVCLADNTLRAVADDRADDTYYENTANDYDLVIPEDMSDGTGMVLEQNGYTMEVIPADGDYTSPVVKENAIRYNDVYENIDVQYTVYDNSIKEDIILNGPTDRKSFSYRIKADGLTAKTGEGVIALQDADGNTVFVLDAPVMEDAAGEVSLGVVLTAEQKGKDLIVTVTPDQDWITASERSYPVKIDPSQIYVDNTKFGLYCVEEGSPRSVIGDNSYPYVGYDDGIVSGNKKNYGTAHLKCRTYIGIDYDFSELGEEAVIEDATFRICQTTHFGGGGNEIGLYTTDAAWTPKSLTWNSQADMSHTFLNSQKTTAKSKEWIEYDITDYVNDHAQGIAEDSGLVLKSIDENAQCEVFYNRTSSLYGPQIVVTWSENGDDPYLATLPLDGLTINVRPMNEKNINGKLTLDAVFADGLATAGAEVDYYLVGEGTKHTTTALKRYAYPNSIPFLEAFPNATRYKSLQSNWQSELYAGFTYNTVYQFRATAKKDGASSTEKASDTFLVYPVARFDTFPKIAAYYGVELNTILKDNRVQDSLVVAGNTIFVRNPATNVPYSPSDLTEAEMAAIDGLLMGRGLHCEFGFEPVNLNTGNFYMDTEDVSIPDIGGSFAISRSYNSKGASINSPFGRGWTFGADESLSMLEDGSIIYKKGDGSFYTMTPGEDGRYYAPAGYAYILTPVYGENAENAEEADKEENTDADEEGEVWEDEPSIVAWTLTDGDYQTHTFNASGMLTSIADRHGNTKTVTYDEAYHLSALTSPSGKTYSFTTDAQGRITNIALPNGAVLAYTYDAEGNLSTCQNANGNIIRYEYDDKHQMTAWYDANGNRVVKNTYDANGRVTEQIDANGNTSSLIYSDGKTETIDNMGNHTVYDYDAQYRTTAIHYADGTTVKKTYDEQNHLASETDEMGNVTTYAYDADGNLVQTTKADGSTTGSAYNDRNLVVTETDANGNVTSYSYDDRDNLINVTYADGTQESYTYDDSNRLIEQVSAAGNRKKYHYNGAMPDSYTDGTGHTWQYAYNAMNLLVEAKDPLGNRTVDAYDKEGRLLQHVTADGGSTAYEYDAVGNVLTITNPRGKKSTFTYDAMSNVLTGTDALGQVIRYEYDKNGQKVTETDTDGETVTYEYDVRSRLISQTDKEGGITTYTYDKNGNLIRITDAEGNTVKYQYDTVNGWKTAEVDGNGNTTSYSYDKNGNLTATIYADGAKSVCRYDSRNRIAESTDVLGLIVTYDYNGEGKIVHAANSLGEETSFTYDGNGQLKSSVNAAGAKTVYNYDKAGRLSIYTDENGAVTAYAYDAAGRRVKTTDAEGNVTETAYDLNGNILTETDANGNKTSYTYDAIDRRTSVTNGNGAITVYEYDAADHVIKVTDALKGETTYSYSKNGNMLSATNANGNTYTYEYDKTGHTLSVTLPEVNGQKNITSVMTYDKAYNLISLTDVQGLKTEYIYDSRNNRVHETDNTGKDNTYTYNAAGSILSITDALERTTAYEYDAKGRLLAVTAADGSTTSYTYDSMDHIVKITDAEGNVTEYSYDAAGNQTGMSQSEERQYQYLYNKINELVKVIDPLGAETSYEYDPTGNLTKVTDADKNTNSYMYDAVGNLTQATDGNGSVTTYAYDLLDRLIETTDAEGGSKAYRYDAVGNLVKAKDENGLITEYVYDALDHMVKSISPLGAVKTYDYDLHGNLTESVDAKKNVTGYDVDLNGNVTKLTQADGGTYTYTYDVAGRMTSVTTPLSYTIQMSYDAVDNLVREKDSMGRVTAYGYDKLHHLTEVTDAEGGHTMNSYDAFGNLTGVTDAMGHVTSYGYDAADRMITVTDPLEQVTEVTYDPAGIVTAITTPGGSKTSYGYDGNYNQTSVTDALGNVTGYQYDKTNRLTSMTDALGNSNKYTYDAAGQLLSYTDRRGSSAGYEYDGHGNMSVYTDPTGHITRYSYDANNNLTEVEDAAGGKTYYEYDSMDRMTAYIDALGRTTVYTYDYAGNLTSLTDDAGRTETNIYDEAGRLTEYVKNSGKRIHYDYDKLNRLIEKSYKTADGEEAEAAVRYGYDADGNRVSMMDTTGSSSYETDVLGRITAVTNGAGKKVTYTYDANGNITAIGYPDGTVVSYEYDANNNLTRVTDREGKIVSYRYDSNNQLKYTNRPESNTATYITYDEEGNITRLMNVCTACDQTLSSYEYTYNEIGYVTEEKATEAVTIYCNDHLNGNGNGNNGNGNGNNGNNGNGNGNGNGNTHPGNNSDGTKHDNCHHGKFGTTKTLSTEDCGCYTAAITTTSSYVYNANWEILSCTQEREGCSNIKYCYKYDDAGNRIEASKWTGNTQTDIVKYTYNDSNQIETSTTLEKKKWVTTTYEYDADGNLVETIAGKAQIKNITTYEYDTENRLKAVTSGKDLLLAITYDGDGNRAFQLDYNPPSKGVGSRDTKIPEGISDAAAELYERITNNGGNASPNYCLTEYLNNVNTNYTGVLAEYGINFDSEVDYTYGMERISIETSGRKRDVYGNKLNSETSKCYYLYNGLGSVERVLDENQETDKFAYDPFGNLTLGYSDNVNSNSLVHRTGNMYTYNGEDYNRETGLQFLRARWYDTNRAVFLSEDSYLGDLLQPLTRNRYLYVCNNPLNFIDPSGHINWSRQLKYLTATVLGLAVGAAALAAFPATIAVGLGAAAATFLMANAVMNKAEAMVQISNNSKKLAENQKTLETASAKLNYMQNKFGTNEERMPSDVRAEVCKLKSTIKTISEQNRQLCDSNAYYQKQDAAGNAQMQMALGTISLVMAPYAGLALAGGGTMAGMTGAALGANAGIGLAIGGFDYDEAYTGKNPAKDFLGENTYEDVRVISNLVSGETIIAGASGVQAIEDARRADEIGNISQNANVTSGGTLNESGSKTGAGEYVAPSGGGGVTSTIKINGRTVNFGHGGRHLEGTGLSVDTVNQALANEVSVLNLGTGQFHKGQIIVDGITIEYTSYGVSEEIINVGTYYPLQ